LAQTVSVWATNKLNFQGPNKTQIAHETQPKNTRNKRGHRKNKRRTETKQNQDTHTQPKSNTQIAKHTDDKRRGAPKTGQQKSNSNHKDQKEGKNKTRRRTNAENTQVRKGEFKTQRSLSPIVKESNLRYSHFLITRTDHKSSAMRPCALR
jgi:hypothetical protein